MTLILLQPQILKSGKRIKPMQRNLGRIWWRGGRGRVREEELLRRGSGFCVFVKWWQRVLTYILIIDTL